MTPSHSTSVLEAFDSIAAVFDSQFENDITRRLRAIIYREAERYLPPAGTILDINCGTGIDALYFLQRGYRVTANDVSPEMIAHTRRKIAPLYPQAEFRTGSFEDLGSISGPAFDAVLSNFGGLNCVRDLGPLARVSGSLVRPGGVAVMIVMPPASLWELAAGMVRGKPRAAFRRMLPGTTATGFNGKTFAVFYHSPSSVLSAFRPWFRLRSLRGLSVVSPPPHATRFRSAFPRFSRLLESADEVLARLPLIRSMGDHWLMVLERKHNS